MPAPIVIAGLAARVVAGIVGRGARNVAPVYRNMSTGSVIKIPKVTDYQQNMVNKMNTDVANERKSGGFAKNSAVQMQAFYKALGGPKKPTIKINSGNTRAR